MTAKEYIIWGRETAEVEHERVLVSEHANIKDMQQARDTLEKLKDWGCLDLWIQVIDFNDPKAINNLFVKSINL